MIGIDEVGRGCWAGPLLIVAVRSNADLPKGLKDSKLMSAKKRQQFEAQIRAICDCGEGWVEASEIDQLGLSDAMKLGVSRALDNLSAYSDESIILDGNVNYCSGDFTDVKCVVKADSIYPEVSAASIVAKVRRDKHMTEIAKNFPGYGFERHVGYGTAVHKQALVDFGVTSIHRKSFKPVRDLI